MPDISLDTRLYSLHEGQDELHAAKAAENFRLLDSLQRSEGWKWFCSEVLEPALKEIRDAALDVESKSAAQREAAAQQHAFAVKLLGLLEERRKFWAKEAGLRI